MNATIDRLLLDAPDGLYVVVNDHGQPIERTDDVFDVACGVMRRGVRMRLEARVQDDDGPIMGVECQTRPDGKQVVTQWMVEQPEAVR